MLNAPYKQRATLETSTEKGIDSACIASEETGVRRSDSKHGDFSEHLDLAASDLTLLRVNGLFIFDHDETRPAGDIVPDSVRLCADDKLRCDVRWHPENQQIRNAIMDGKRPNAFSCGYDWLHETKRETRSDGLHIWFAVRFIEFSCLLSDPAADDNAGLYRSLTKSKNNMRLDTILELALSGSRQTGDTLTRELQNDYPLREAILTAGTREERPRLVREVQSAAPRFICGTPLSGDYLPWACLLPRQRQQRDMTAGIFAQGGAFVQSDMHPSIELLRNRTVAAALGAVVVPGLRGNFIAPRISADVSAQSLPETGGVTPSQILAEQAGLTPRRVSVQVPVSNLLLTQTDNGAEDVIRAQIAAAIGVTMDTLILNGQGGNDEPQGIMQTPAIGSVIYAGAATWAKVLASEKSLADQNADFTSKLGWAISPSTRNAWKQTTRSAGSSLFLMEGDRVNDYPALATNTLSGTHQSVFGNFADCWILLWADGLTVNVDRVTQARAGETIITAHIYFNVLVRHAQSFCVSADAGNQ